MKVILCGYHWTGCKALTELLGRGYRVYVYTHPVENACPDLAGLCRKLDVPYSLEKITRENLPFQPDMICSIYYRYIIGGDVIRAANGKIFNLHPALLPKYRGCSSLTWAMVNGETECGFTYHYIDEGCDTGRILLQKAIAIEPFDTQLTLYHRVMVRSMEPFLPVCDLVVAGYEGSEQTGEASYYKRGCPYDGVIDPAWDRARAERFIRAMLYPPYPAARYEGKYVLSLEQYDSLKIPGGESFSSARADMLGS